MPKQTRWAIKREFDQVEAHINKAINALAILGAVFHDQHPEIYEALSAVCAALDSVKTVVQQQRDQI
ncbi:unnamed protein product [marine sediment metagenome]|uniref:Uncharacterized protein n=1 Tax=marine sediment metagenome TaxID=412755 RepID=X0UJC8_9ZZZZ